MLLLSVVMVNYVETDGFELFLFVMLLQQADILVLV